MCNGARYGGTKSSGGRGGSNGERQDGKIIWLCLGEGETASARMVLESSWGEIKERWPAPECVGRFFVSICIFYLLADAVDSLISIIIFEMRALRFSNL